MENYMNNSEIIRLNGVADWFSNNEGFNSRLIYYVIKKIEPYLTGNSVLELGCADGKVTNILPNYFKEITVVEGSVKYIEIVKQKLNHKGNFINSLFEEFETAAIFDVILALHIFEHVIDPISILKKARGWLKSDGYLIVSVPNALSIHRNIGVKMGLIKKIDELNDRDLKLGHRRVYTPDLLREQLSAAGYKVIKMGGAFLKPLSNSQIETQWDEELMDAFHLLSEEYPEVSTPLVAIANRSDD